MDKLNAALKQRDEMESRMKEIIEYLNQPGPNGKPPVGLHGNLLDPDGFPRDDIDLWKIRELRHELAILRTDYESLTRSLENLTFQAFADIKKANAVSQAVEHISSPEEARILNHPEGNHREIIKRPFGSLRTVDEDGVCGRSGLLDCDRLVSFGEIDRKTYRGLQEFSEYVSRCRGKTIEVEVERDRVGGIERLKVLLTIPQEGGLGIHFIPLH